MRLTSFTILWPTPRPRVMPLPLFSGKVAAGFPSPADDYVEKTLDLNELLIQKPAATFFVRAQGESMLGAGIHPNDHEESFITPENERYCAGGSGTRSI
jgi:DNA polymerase V